MGASGSQILAPWEDETCSEETKQEIKRLSSEISTFLSPDEGTISQLDLFSVEEHLPVLEGSFGPILSFFLQLTLPFHHHM